MIETFNIFWSSPIELRVIILDNSDMLLVGFFGENIKESKKKRHQARLNSVKTKI